MKIILNKIMKSQKGFARKKIIIIALIVLIALAIVFILTTRKEETIKIGAVLSLSGPGQSIGEGLRDGLFLAVDEINNWGGINGKKIELIIEDSKTDPEEGKKAFDKIESTHHPVLYLSSHSSTSMALAPLAQEQQVVLLGLVVMAPKFTENQEWVYRYWPTAKAETPSILSILEDLRVKKLGILYQDDEFGRSVFELLQKEFKATGGLVEAEHFKPVISDLKESIGRLINMEAIHVVGFTGLIENILNQLKEANFKGTILGGNAFAFPEIIALPVAQGVYFTAPIIYNPNFPFAQEIDKKYVKKYNKRFSHSAAGAYDLIKIITGLWGNEEISRERVKSLLDEGFTYSGVFGIVNVRPGEHDISFPLYPAQIINGEVKYR